MMRRLGRKTFQARFRCVPVSFSLVFCIPDGTGIIVKSSRPVVIPAPCFENGKKYTRICCRRFPLLADQNLRTLFLSTAGGVTDYSCGDMRWNARSGSTIEVTQTNGQSRKLAVGSGPFCKLLFAVPNENQEMLDRNFDDQNVEGHFPCRARQLGP